MVLAAIWEKRNRCRHIAQGREEANKDWRDWLQRRDAAAANGLPFDEPMPGTIKDHAPNPPPSHPA